LLRGILEMEVFDDEASVARRAAVVIATHARDAVSQRGKFLMAVSGGKTPWICSGLSPTKRLPGNTSTYFRSMNG
jgi:hypothetical protein